MQSMPTIFFKPAELVADALSLWQAGGRCGRGTSNSGPSTPSFFDSPKGLRAGHRCFNATLGLHNIDCPLSALDEPSRLTSHCNSVTALFTNQLVYRWVTEQKKSTKHEHPRRTSPRRHMETDCVSFTISSKPTQVFIGTCQNLRSTGKRIRPTSREQYLDEVEGEDSYDDGDETDDGEDLFRHAYDDVTYTDTTNDGNEGEIFEGNTNSDEDLEAEVDRVLDRLEFLNTVSEYWSVAATIPLPVISREQLTDKITDRLKKRRDIINNWITQAAKNRKQLLELLESINQYRLPTLVRTTTQCCCTTSIDSAGTPF